MTDSTKTLTVYRKSHGELKFEAKIEFKRGENLLQLLNASKILIHQSCGGHGICTTCRVLVKKTTTELNMRTEIEAERAEERGFAIHERLSCQLELESDVEIIIP